MTSMRFLTWVGMGAALALAGAASCGARSDTVTDVGAASTTGTAGAGASGGAGGTGGNGGSGNSGGSGGSGGETPQCTVLEEVIVKAPPYMNSLLPRLAHSGVFDEKERAVLGLIELPEGGPPGITTQAHTLGLEPWGAWPPPLSLTAMLSNIEGQISIAEGINADLAALYMTPAGDVLYSPDLLAGAPGPGAGLDDATKAASCFLAKQQTGHAFGLGMSSTLPSGESATEIAVGFAALGPSGPALGWLVPLGCSQGGAIADGEAVNGGVLAAFASGTTPLELSGCAGGLEPGFPFANRMVVAKVTGNPTTAMLGAVDDGYSQVGAIAMAGRSDGAWVVWSRFPLQGDPGTIEAARLDADGNFAAGPWTLAQGFGLHTASIGADRLGDDLVVAWAETAQVPMHIEVRRLDGTGAEVAKGSFEGKESLMQAIAVLGSPAGADVLLAYSLWSEAEQHAKVHLRRLGCAQ